MCDLRDFLAGIYLLFRKNSQDRLKIVCIVDDHSSVRRCGDQLHRKQHESHCTAHRRYAFGEHACGHAFKRCIQSVRPTSLTWLKKRPILPYFIASILYLRLRSAWVRVLRHYTVPLTATLSLRSVHSESRQPPETSQLAAYCLLSTEIHPFRRLDHAEKYRNNRCRRGMMWDLRCHHFPGRAACGGKKDEPVETSWGDCVLTLTPAK